MSEVAKLSYNIGEAAAAMGVSRASIYNRVKAGELTTFKWCGRTLIPAEELLAALARARGRVAA